MATLRSAAQRIKTGRLAWRQHLPERDRYISAEIDPVLTFNIIGLGVNGLEHMRNTFNEGRATIKGVYDSEPLSVAAAQEQFRQFVTDRDLVVYDSVATCCSDPDVDGIIIATPNYTHIDLVRDVRESGKHVLLEKPMATTITDAWEIVQIAADYPSVFQIGLQYRYKAMYAEAAYEAKTRRSLGEIKTMSITEHRVPFFDKVNQWNKFAKYSGDTLVEKCCHYFDLFNLFADSRPERVYASGSMAVCFTDFVYEGQGSDILDNAMVIVDYANGIRANFELCMFAPMFWEEFTLCGDAGRLAAFRKQDFLRGSPECSLQVLSNELAVARTMTPEYPGALESLGHDGATYFEHVSFVDNILGKPTNTASVTEGFWSVVVGVAAQESIRTGQPVLTEELLSDAGICI